ncbi:MAG: TonB-dependent receptor, partial [Sphingomonadales bacterium]
METKSFIRSCLSAVSATAILASGGAALAQQPGADRTRVIEEVVVTARRFEESLQDVPATVTVLTETVLRSAGVERAEDFIRMTPGVTIVDAAEVGDTQVNIRGINGARDAENSFAFIVDGVLMTNPAAFNREFVDLQQIEILKGPQGALYGRNAAAGAIIVTTRKPGNDLRGEFRASYANHQSFFGSATISGPLVEDQLFFNLHFDWRDTDGFYTNTFLNSNTVDRFENYNFSGRLVWEPNPGTSLDIKARYGEVDGSAITFNAAFALENFAGAFGAPAAFEDVNEHPFVFQQNITSDNNQKAFEISAKLDEELDFADLTVWMLYSDIDNDFIADGTSGAFGFFASDPVCQASTAALFNGGAGAFTVLPPPQFIGATPVPVLVANPPFDANGVPQGSFFGPYTPTTCDGIQEQIRLQEDFSVEMRLASKGDGAFRWQVGAYFLDIRRRVGVSLNRDDGNPPIRGLFQRAATSPNFTEALLDDRFDSRVFAVFGNVSYDLTQDIEISLALRYDNENRKVTNLVPTDVVTQFVDFDGDFIPGGSPLNPALLFNPNGVPPQQRTFQEVEPKFSFTWDVTPDLTFFGSWGKGFKAGGFNNVGSAATIDIFINDFISLVDPNYIPVAISDSFDKETSSAFEFGFKGDMLDGRLTFEAAVYRVDVTNMQSF